MDSTPVNLRLGSWSSETREEAQVTPGQMQQSMESLEGFHPESIPAKNAVRAWRSSGWQLEF